MKNNKFLIIVIMTFSLGIIMLLGSSYSLIIGEANNSNVIVIPEFNDYYQKDIKISIINNKLSEYNFEIINKSNSNIKYRVNINQSPDKKINEIINYSYTINNYKSGTLNLESNNIIIQNHSLYRDMNDLYKVNFFFSDIYDNLEPFNTTISIFVMKDNTKYATEIIGELNSNEIKKVDDEIRFISENPNNYVWFNCDDNHDNCEKWRIIGSFNQKVENGIDSFKSLKIMREESNDEMPFNKDELDGKYDNSFANSYLNGFYYEKMNDLSKKLILNAKYNIGDVSELDYENAYKAEKEESFYAYVGLLNPSDYLYPDNKWMNINEKILLLNKNENNINVIDNGIINDDAYIDMAYIPVVYLRSDVSFINGDGTIDNPYELDIILPLAYGTLK